MPKALAEPLPPLGSLVCCSPFAGGEYAVSESDLNEQYGCHGDYQNHAGDWVGSPVWDLNRLQRELRSAQVGCRYDVGPAAVDGGTLWTLGLRRMAAWIRTAVAKDYRRRLSEDAGFASRSVPKVTGRVRLLGLFPRRAPKGAFNARSCFANV